MGVLHVKNNTVGDFTGTVTVGNSAGATTTIAATDLVRPSDWNSAHSQVITLSGNTSINSTAGGTNLHIQGAGLVTVAGSTGTLVISGPAVGTISGTIVGPYDNKMPHASSVISLGQNSVHIYPCHIESHLSMEHMRVPVSIANSSSAAASVQRGHTMDVGIYSRHATNATVLTLHYSTSYTMAASHNSNASWMISIITAIQNSTSYLSQTASSAGINLSSSLHGLRELIMPLSTLLSPGEYWWAIRQSSSSAGAAGAVLGISHVGVALQTYNRPGQVLNSSNSAFLAQNAGLGVYSTTTGALPGGITITNGIRNNGSQGIIFLAMGTV